MTVKALLAWAALFAFYAAAPVRMQTDSLWNVPTALSLARDADTELGEYGALVDERPHGLERRDGLVHSTFPLGPAVLAAPVLWLVDRSASLMAQLPAPASKPFERWLTASAAASTARLSFFDTTEVLLASALVAAGVVFFFLALLGTGVSRHAALIVSGSLALGGPALSTWTRSYWTHGPAFACLALAAALLFRPSPRLRSWAGLGLCVALAVVCRPTALPGALVIAAAAMVTSDWRRRLAVLAGAGLVLVPWFGWSFRIWGVLVPPYYASSRLEAGAGDFLRALSGQLFSPSRGLLIFVPLVLLAVAVPLRRGTHLFALGLGLLHLVVIARFPHWWGGHSFGPRLSSDAVPFLLFAAAPVVERALERWPGRAAIAVLCSWGLVVNLPAAFSWATWQWNETPVDVDLKPERVWDWSDPQSLRR